MPSTLIDKFKHFYVDIENTDLSKLSDLYANDIVFKDPIHEIRGIVALEDYMSGMYQNLDQACFEYLDQLSTDEAAYIKWLMHFQHPRLGSKRISVRGVTHIHFDEKIYFQEDVYDVGAMLYDNIPVLGSATRWLKHRIAV